MSFEPLTDERIETDSTYDAGTTTQLMWGARSDVGCVRPHNEDSYLVQSPLFCVCDGMGGHAAGEVASSIAVETIAKTAPQSADAARLAAAVEAANAAVIEAALNGLGKPGMGCTATCAYIENDTLAIAHVGDSRAYLLHEGTLIRVTRDHSYVEELVDAGEITADEARVHPNRSVITRALGSDPAMYADHFTLHIEEGDRLILCSDGLSSMIPDSDIENIATQSSTAQICVDNLVDAALAAGGGFWAFSQRDAAPAALGTEYHIQKLNDNALTEPEQELTCTITIRCDTVLQSLDSLREEKLPYVPRDGVMLPDEKKQSL